MNVKGIKTPCYIIDEDRFNNNCLEFEEKFYKTWGTNIILGYSVKTNYHRYLLSLAQRRSWYAEVVSEREYYLAIKSGFQETEIIFNGPVKGKALKSAISTETIINLDNFDEIFILIENKHRILCNVGIRVNFDLEKKCYGETTAGEYPSRFGICYENGDLERAIKLLADNKIKLAGLHMHTSTKTRSKKVFYEISKIVCELKRKYDLELKYIDMGGGFFGGKEHKSYPSVNDYAEVICCTLKQEFSPDRTTLILEPGAAVIATAVDYITKVCSIKQIREEGVITVDGSNLHINPFMSKRVPNYEIVGKTGKIKEIQHICGSTCMENDRMVLLRDQNEIAENNYVIFHDAGAYTMCLNNSFINNPPEVYIRTKSGIRKYYENEENV